MLNTFGSGVDTVLSVFRRQPALALMACNDEFNPVDGTSQVKVKVESQLDSLVQMDTVGGAGAVRLTSIHAAVEPSGITRFHEPSSEDGISRKNSVRKPSNPREFLHSDGAPGYGTGRSC